MSNTKDLAIVDGKTPRRLSTGIVNIEHPEPVFELGTFFVTRGKTWTNEIDNIVEIPMGFSRDSEGHESIEGSTKRIYTCIGAHQWWAARYYAEKGEIVGTNHTGASLYPLSFLKENWLAFWKSCRIVE